MLLRVSAEGSNELQAPASSLADDTEADEDDDEEEEDVFDESNEPKLPTVVFSKYVPLSLLPSGLDSTAMIIAGSCTRVHRRNMYPRSLRPLK